MEGAALTLGIKKLDDDSQDDQLFKILGLESFSDFLPFFFSDSARYTGPVVFVGWGDRRAVTRIR
jgi:hypothetical protein